MVATVNVEEGNGSGPTWTVITSGRYCTRDAYNPGDNDPCVVPTSNLNRSYWKSHRIAWTGIGTKISQVRWYTSGNVAKNWATGTNGGLFVCIKSAGTSMGCPTGNYDQATGTPGETGDNVDDVTVGHAYYKSGTSNHNVPVNADTYVSATPLLVDDTEYTTNTHSYHVVTQVVLGTDATQGDKPSETFTFRYNEV
jgi:hypothetical protein